MREWWRRRRLRCRIQEEWCGSFIGRRWCSTHEVRWDDGGRCPSAGQEIRQGTPS